MRHSTGKEVITYEDWALIESFMQDVSLIESGLASEQYKNAFEEQLQIAAVEYATLKEVADPIRKR